MTITYTAQYDMDVDFAIADLALTTDLEDRLRAALDSDRGPEIQAAIEEQVTAMLRLHGVDTDTGEWHGGWDADEVVRAVLDAEAMWPQVDWAVRGGVPVWLDSVGLTEHAARLRAAQPIRDLATARAAGGLLAAANTAVTGHGMTTYIHCAAQAVRFAIVAATPQGEYVAWCEANGVEHPHRGLRVPQPPSLREIAIQRRRRAAGSAMAHAREVGVCSPEEFYDPGHVCGPVVRAVRAAVADA